MSLCLAPLQILGVQFMVWPRVKFVIFRFGAFSLSQGPPSYCPYYPIIKSWLITGPLHSPAPADKSDTSWRGEKGENFFLSPLIFSFLSPSLSNLTFSNLWIFYLANLVFSLNFSTLWIHLIFHCFESHVLQSELEIRRLHWLFSAVCFQMCFSSVCMRICKVTLVALIWVQDWISCPPVWIRDALVKGGFSK